MKKIIICAMIAAAVASCKSNTQCGRIYSVKAEPIITYSALPAIPKGLTQEQYMSRDNVLMRKADIDSMMARNERSKDTASNFTYSLSIVWDNGAQTVESVDGKKDAYHEDESYCITLKK